MKWLYSVCALLSSLTISEKKESFGTREHTYDYQIEQKLSSFNDQLCLQKEKLERLYQEVYTAFVSKNDIELHALLEQIRACKLELLNTQLLWKKESKVAVDPYGLWQHPDTNVQQLVIDFGSHEYLYVIPPEIGGIRLSINSNVPIPKESWSECLEIILEHHGIGVRQASQFIKELYFLHREIASFKAMISSQKELDIFPDHTRLCYVLQTDGLDKKRNELFLHRFANQLTTNIHLIGTQFFIVGPAHAIKELLTLYQFAQLHKEQREHQLLMPHKFSASDMAMLLSSLTDPSDPNALHLLPLSSGALFLSGSSEEVSKAVNLLHNLEKQIENPLKKVLFWYTAKHSDPQELASLMTRVYHLLRECPQDLMSVDMITQVDEGSEAYHGSREWNKTACDFVVDAKTGCIVMVVEQEHLPKLKEVIKKLDVPKKMVQIEVLLFEKKLSHQSRFGINLLRLGSESSKTASSTGASWNKAGKGILEFIIGRTAHGDVPAFDLAYQFLLGQVDVQINAAPYATTVNHTPVTMSVVDEISLYMGEQSEGQNSKTKGSYTRARYGITIQVTPTINQGDHGQDFITLDTDIMFDTTHGDQKSMPDVTRRHIKNQVRIPDGQTVVLGGLRCKNGEDKRESIPFLGEIPGFGKLFSTTSSSQTNSEMFIFITPRIVPDSLEQADQLRMQDLLKRPGDVPEFLDIVQKAKEKERQKLFTGTLKTLFASNASAFKHRGHYG